MKRLVVVLACLSASLSAFSELKAGVARVSVTPSEEKLPFPLGGYGERAGKPAEGVHDTLYAKVMVFDWNGQKSAIITIDACSAPYCVLKESVDKANVPGLTPDAVLLAASHTHAGLEGMSLDRRNLGTNAHLGVFSEPLLNFVTTRIAKGLTDANAALQPVRAAAGVVTIPGMLRNRRNDPFLDEDLTALRLDTAEGRPYAVLVNFTGHGTIVSAREMLASGEWAGAMQRTVEAILGEGVTCLYTNGAEGDITTTDRRGASAWERLEDYGRRVGVVAARLASAIKTRPVTEFAARTDWVDLPPHKVAANFAKIAGEEYHVTQKEVEKLFESTFPKRAPVCALRVNDFQMVTFPGEPICQFGLKLKAQMRNAGIKYPCVAALTDDSIGYILTKEEYLESGYEATASFYGEGLGELLLERTGALAGAVAQAN